MVVGTNEINKIAIINGSGQDYFKKAIDAGFTSVMIDSSIYDLDENIKIVNEVCDYARIYDVSVEAEIGNIGTSENINSDCLDKTNYDGKSRVRKMKIDINR